MIGDYTEFENYNNAPSIIYDIAYYDKDKKFIKKESCHVNLVLCGEQRCVIEENYFK